MKKNGTSGGIRHASNDKIILMLVVMIIFSAIVAILNPKFLTVANFLNIFQQVAVLGILAVGMTFVIITGGIDLSVGNGVTMGVVIVGSIFMQTQSAWLAMLIGFAACLALGVLNGVFVARLKIMPFVATLATMSVAQGLTVLIGSSKMLQLKDPVFDFIGKTSLGGLAVSTLIMLLFVIAGTLVLKNTKLGSYTYALGSNEKNAKLAGINISGYKFAIYSLQGACVGVACIVLGSRITLVTLSSGGSSLLMDTIAAVILGGVSTAGGSGKMPGTLVGIIFMGIISNALTLLNVPAVAQDLFKGVVIVSALVLNAMSAGMARRGEKRKRIGFGLQKTQ